MTTRKQILLAVIENFAEARHKQGHSTYNAKTQQALDCVKATIDETFAAVQWKDHQTARLVNALTDAANTFGSTQQLRERISQLVCEAVNEMRSAKFGDEPIGLGTAFTMGWDQRGLAHGIPQSPESEQAVRNLSVRLFPGDKSLTQLKTEKLVAALEAARNGLRWYEENIPGAASSADDEMHAQIREALGEPNEDN